MRPLLLVWLAILPAFAQKPNIRLVEGQGAINVIDNKTERDFAVLLEERNGTPRKEVQVTFSAPSSGASGSFKGKSRTVTVKTNKRGYAVARGYRPNNLAGRYNITVTAAVPGGSVLHSTIAQTNALPTEGDEGEAKESVLRRPKKLFGRLRSTVTGLFNE